MPAAATVVVPLRVVLRRFGRAGRVDAAPGGARRILSMRRWRLRRILLLRHLHGLRPRRVQSRNFILQLSSPSERGHAAAATRHRLLLGRVQCRLAFPALGFFPALARFAREKKNITGNLSDHGTLGNMPLVNSPVNLPALKRPPSMASLPKNTFSGAVPGRPRICRNKPHSPLEHHQRHLRSKGQVARWSGGNTFFRGAPK
jgi:hypothetical protein